MSKEYHEEYEPQNSGIDKRRELLDDYHMILKELAVVGKDLAIVEISDNKKAMKRVKRDIRVLIEELKIFNRKLTEIQRTF